MKTDYETTPETPPKEKVDAPGWERFVDQLQRKLQWDFRPSGRPVEVKH